MEVITMLLAQKRLGAIQNVGWMDRIVRVLIGAALVAVVFVDIYEGQPLGWDAYLPLLAIYPLITAILGWDPLYSAGHIKTCDGSKRNQCGTFPYEMESAMGKDVHCRDGYDCSVGGSESDTSGKTKVAK
jgi:hypothetical protein